MHVTRLQCWSKACLAAFDWGMPGMWINSMIVCVACLLGQERQDVKSCYVQPARQMFAAAVFPGRLCAYCSYRQQNYLACMCDGL